MKILETKLFSLVLLVLGTFWLWLFLPFYTRYGHQAAFVAIIVFGAVLCVVLTFSARIRPEGDGVSVEQLKIRHMEFGDLLDCAFVPFLSSNVSSQDETPISHEHPILPLAGRSRLRKGWEDNAGRFSQQARSEG